MVQQPVNDFMNEETFGDLLQTLEVDFANTYVAIGHGDAFRGVSPVVTKPVVSRRITMTRCGADQWCAVDVTTTPGVNYHFGATVHYVVL